MSEWTEERNAQLKQLWNDGLSASQIARVMGGGVSRNAVIGRVHRMGLAGRATPRRERPPAKTKEPRAMRPDTLPDPADGPALEPIIEDGGAVTTMKLTDRHCRWPIGDPLDADFHYCGHPPASQSPYCAAHTRKAFQHTTPAQRRNVGTLR
jgi:GcrA cell cycle regulator